MSLTSCLSIAVHELLDVPTVRVDIKVLIGLDVSRRNHHITFIHLVCWDIYHSYWKVLIAKVYMAASLTSWTDKSWIELIVTSWTRGPSQWVVDQFGTVQCIYRYSACRIEKVSFENGGRGDVPGRFFLARVFVCGNDRGNDRSEVEVDALSDWKPLKFQHRLRDVVLRSKIGDESGSNNWWLHWWLHYRYFKRHLHLN